MKILGCIALQEIVLPTGRYFYQFLVNEDRLHDGGTIYLSPLPGPTAELHAAIRDSLRIGSPQENPAAAAARAEEERNPESGPHFGIMVDTLEEVDAIALRLEEAVRQDPDLHARVTLTVNRAKRGDAQIDAAMDASPIFAKATRYCYGRYGCQIFVHTDLLVGGALGESYTIELDHAFKNRPMNMFNKTELG